MCTESLPRIRDYSRNRPTLRHDGARNRPPLRRWRSVAFGRLEPGLTAAARAAALRCGATGRRALRARGLGGARCLSWRLLSSLHCDPRPTSHPPLFAAVARAPAALALAVLGALLAVLRAVPRAADADLAPPLARVLRELAALLPAPRALLVRALPLRALRARRPSDVASAVGPAEREELPVALRPGVIDLASCSRSLISDRLVDFASRRNVRSVSATSLYAPRAFLPKSARIVCSASVASSSAFSKRAVAASTSWRVIGASGDLLLDATTRSASCRLLGGRHTCFSCVRERWRER